MKRFFGRCLAVLVLAAGFVGCAALRTDAGWTTLVGSSDSLQNWNRLGDANWRIEDGMVVADKASVASYLVSKNSYKDFQIRAEFRAETTTNSGIFIRLADPTKVAATNSYEVNIYDQRPEPIYGTGAIVDFAKVDPMPKAGGRWNTFLITAKGTNLIVEMNGVQTANIQNSKYASGPIALQFGNGPKDAPGGAIKWRKVQITPL